jgi:hypothetical protein
VGGGQWPSLKPSDLAHRSSGDRPRSWTVPRDAEMLTVARRTPSGGWVVQITDAPLDYDNTAYLDALKRAFERFPQIGGRDSP